MLSVNREAVRAAGALAVLLIDTIVNNLNNAWQVSPPIIINILILLQCLLRIPHKHLIPLQFLEPVVDLIAVLTLLEDGVELEIERFSRDVFPLGTAKEHQLDRLIESSRTICGWWTFVCLKAEPRPRLPGGKL